MPPFSDSDLASFRSVFAGAVLRPGDEQFEPELTRAIWNGDIRRRPALIAAPTTPQAVAAAIEFADRQGLGVTVRGGGHSFAGHAVSDDGLMINLGVLNNVVVDPGARRVRCGGGTSWAQLDAATAAHGLAVTGGFISHTGVAGLTLGGGMGWLTRRAGLTCDNLVSAEVVTADGRVVTASPRQHPDLFWGLRGGGGNFGVVTSFEFTLHEVAPIANLGLFFWLPADARGPLCLARELLHTLPHEFGGLIAGLSAPPAPFVPEPLQGVAGFAVAVAHWGSADEHATAIAPLRALAPAFELVTPIPYVALQQMFDSSASWGFHGYEKALYLDELTDPVIDTAIEFLPRKASPTSFTPIFPLGGAFAEVGDDDTAFGGSRATRWAFNIAAIAPVPELLTADREWVRDFWTALRPHAPNSGGYVNFLADTDDERVRSAYGPTKYDRLAQLKTAWDPDNVFRHNANIRPATAIHS